MSNRDLLYTIVYGDLAHSNRDKQAVVPGWKTAGLMYEVAFSEFVKVLAIVVLAAAAVEKVNAKALAQLPA